MKKGKNKNKKLLKLASKFQPWDWGYMIMLEKQTLKQMQEYHKTAEIIVDSPKIARQIKWALKLLDIADETTSAWHCSGDLYVDNNGCVGRNPNYKTWIDTYVNTKNWKRFWPLYKAPNFETPHNQDYLRQQKAWYIYNKIRFYYLQTWWE